MIPDGMRRSFAPVSCNRESWDRRSSGWLRDAAGVHGERIVAREFEDWLTARQGTHGTG